MIPLKVQCPLPTYRNGAVSARGTILGKKGNYFIEHLVVCFYKVSRCSPEVILMSIVVPHTFYITASVTR